MRRAVDLGVWRSHLGDTWPHVGVDVERDWWPQSTHLVWETDPLVVCASGAGGGSQQAMFRRELDPLLAGALTRWHARAGGLGPRDALHDLFVEIQRGFSLLDVSYANELQASAVAFVREGDRAAIGHVGLERAWRVRDGVVEQLTADDSLGASMPGPTVQDWVYRLPMSWFGKAGDVERWRIVEHDVHAGDIYVLAAGIADIDFAIEPLPAGNAQAIAATLGERAFATASEDQARWRVGSRLSIGVVITL